MSRGRLPPQQSKKSSPLYPLLPTFPYTYQANDELDAWLAQSVERETLKRGHNLKVAGSTPASGSIPVWGLVLFPVSPSVDIFPLSVHTAGWWKSVDDMHWMFCGFVELPNAFMIREFIGISTSSPWSMD